MTQKTDPWKFACVASKHHAIIAGDMADQIKDIIFSYSDQIPLALAIGVLRIVEKEILDSAP